MSDTKPSTVSVWLSSVDVGVIITDTAAAITFVRHKQHSPILFSYASLIHQQTMGGIRPRSHAFTGFILFEAMTEEEHF